MNTPSPYRPLLGKRRTLFGTYSLWLASDHMLAVRSRRFREEYKRYYFREVQAIAVQDRSGTSLVKWWDAAVLLGIILLFMLVVRTFNGQVATGVLLVLYLASFARRSTCDCRLYTAVSADRLPSLHRVRRARRAMDVLQPLFQQAQQHLIPGPHRTGETVSSVGRSPTFEPASPPVLAGPEMTPLSPRLFWLHAALFTLVPVDAVLGLVSAQSHMGALLYVNVTILLAETALAAGTFIQPDVPVSAALRGVVAGSLFYVYGRYVLVYTGVIMAATFAAALRREKAKPFDVTAVFRSQYPHALEIALAFVVLAAGLSLAGFYLLWRERKRDQSASS